MKHILFVCSQNRLRSPTAEQIFSDRPAVETASAGTNVSAITPLSDELIEWADLIVAMEKAHRAKIQRRYGRLLGSKRLICIDIPDNYAFMDEALIALLRQRMGRHLPATA